MGTAKCDLSRAARTAGPPLAPLLAIPRTRTDFARRVLSVAVPSVCTTFWKSHLCNLIFADQLQPAHTLSPPVSMQSSDSTALYKSFVIHRHYGWTSGACFSWILFPWFWSSGGYRENEEEPVQLRINWQSTEMNDKRPGAWRRKRDLSQATWNRVLNVTTKKL